MISNRQTIVAVVVATMAVLAGCNGFDRPTSRVTYDVPPTTEGGSTSGPRVTEGERLPGLTRAGVENASRLSAAHRAALSGRSFRADYNRSVSLSDGGVLRRERLTVVIAANRTRFRVRSDTVVAGGRSSQTGHFSTGDVPVFWMVDTDGAPPRYGVASRPSGPVPPQTAMPVDPTLGSFLERYLAVGDDATVEASPRLSDTEFYVETDDLDAAVGAYGDRAGTASLRAIVDADGHVMALTVRYDAVQPGRDRTVRVVERIRFSRLDAARVRAPPWLSAAQSNTGLSTRSADLTTEVDATATQNTTASRTRPTDDGRRAVSGDRVSPEVSM